PPPPLTPPFPYTTLFRSNSRAQAAGVARSGRADGDSSVRFREALEALVGVDVLLDHVEHHLAGRLHPIHGAHHLTHEVRVQLLRSEEHTSELQSRFDLVC